MPGENSQLPIRHEFDFDEIRDLVEVTGMEHIRRQAVRILNITNPGAIKMISEFIPAISSETKAKSKFDQRRAFIHGYTLGLGLTQPDSGVIEAYNDAVDELFKGFKATIPKNPTHQQDTSTISSSEDLYDSLSDYVFDRANFGLMQDYRRGKLVDDHLDEYFNLMLAEGALLTDGAKHDPAESARDLSITDRVRLPRLLKLGCGLQFYLLDEAALTLRVREIVPDMDVAVKQFFEGSE